MPSTNVVKTSANKNGVPVVASVVADVVNGNNITGLSKQTVVTVENVHATLAKTVTFITSRTVDGLAVADRTISIPAVSTRVFSDLDPALFGKTLEITAETVDIKLSATQP